MMNLRKRFKAQITVISVFLLFLFAGLTGGFLFQVTKLKEYKIEIANLNKEISDTKSKIKELKEIERSNDLENIARTRLNMVKQDEIIYIDTERR